MRHHIFEESDSYRVAILIKAAAFQKHSLVESYVNPLLEQGLSMRDMIAFTLAYNDTGKAPAGFIKDYLAELLPVLTSLNITHLYVADANYFKTLTGQTKAEPHYGYVLPCKVKGFEHLNVCLGVNHQQLIYNPEIGAKLALTTTALATHVTGSYKALGTGIIHAAEYPEGLETIRAALNRLHWHQELSCDIEAFSLRFNEAGIGTVAFAWDKHCGLAFACDYQPNPSNQKDETGEYGKFVINAPVRALLLEFFSTYKGKITWHNAAYDVKVIIYTLWMQNLRDTKGLLTGLDIMTRRFDDTKLITYLATNSTAGNTLGLKANAHEFSGNYAKEDIKDIRRIPLPELLQYNLIDALSTNYVKEKNYPIMVRDNQEHLYHSQFLPTQKMLIQVELTGMPMSKNKIAQVRAKLEGMQAGYLKTIAGNALLKPFEDMMTEKEWVKDYESRKAKAKNPDKILRKDRDTFPQFKFNPNSGPQLQILLYEMMGLPVLDKTDTGQPATGAETIEKLINHVSSDSDKEFMQALIGHGQVVKILSTFIPAFEAGIEKAADGIIWLHGSFNLGGTVSGRLSSSDPNLQNIPANSIFGKIIKECFCGPMGWVFAGADFNSLEDYISALTTKDPNKLKVYIDGFDGHCLRAAFYFEDELIAQGIRIDINDPKSVNSLKKLAPEWRQESKTPTFALTYQGTYHTLMANLGWPEEKAKRIEKAYHDLYVVSDQYIQDRLKQANKDGYVEVAFGLRLRTPLIKQVVWGSRSMPYEAAAEGRTAGNAMGQSYGMLNSRAAVEFMEKVWASPYRYDILPVALIHDAIYLLIKEDVAVIEWANRELIKSMQWQELPEIQHDTVKLGAALDLFWPNWANPITLPNNADQATIKQMCRDAYAANQDKLKSAA